MDNRSSYTYTRSLSILGSVGSVLRYCLSRPSCSIRMCLTHMTSSTSVYRIDMLIHMCACVSVCANVFVYSHIVCILVLLVLHNFECRVRSFVNFICSYSTLHCWQSKQTDWLLKSHTARYTVNKFNFSTYKLKLNRQNYCDIICSKRLKTKQKDYVKL